MLSLAAVAISSWHSTTLRPAEARARVGTRRITSSPLCSSYSLTSLQHVADQYDAFLLDQFGVIHDGKNAYDGAVDAVTKLQRAGKKIVIISNSSRRRSDTVARLKSMGFGPCDDGIEGDADPPIDGIHPISVVTSGDLVFQGLGAVQSSPPFEDLGMRCFVFGNGDDDEDYVREAGKVAAPIDKADFILARGLFSMLGAGPDLLWEPSAPYSLEAESAVLQLALERRPGGLPLLVANPDEVRPDGRDSPMPGQLAKRYREMGASDLRLVGKPHSLIYKECELMLKRAGFAQARVAAVGDSLHHDVLGGARYGIDTIFCCSGVHSTELGVPQAEDQPPEAARLAALLERFATDTDGYAPTHILPAFRM